jgi:stage II sporulation protein AB (anti-sigma F factor)
LVAAIEHLIERYPAAPTSVALARNDVGRLAADARAGREQLESIRMAVSEAVTNAIAHGYRGGGGEIELRATVMQGDLHVWVRDRGCGFQTPAENPGLGWGLPLIAHSSDEFVIAERPGGGTEVRMRFLIADRSAQAS